MNCSHRGQAAKLSYRTSRNCVLRYLCEWSQKSIALRSKTPSNSLSTDTYVVA